MVCYAPVNIISLVLNPLAGALVEVAVHKKLCEGKWKEHLSTRSFLLQHWRLPNSGVMLPSWTGVIWISLTSVPGPNTDSKSSETVHREQKKNKQQQQNNLINNYNWPHFNLLASPCNEPRHTSSVGSHADQLAICLLPWRCRNISRQPE